MFEKRTVADYVVSAGLCLLALATIDGSIKLFEHFTGISLWMTCGTIGLLLLVVVNVALSVFEKDAPLRRGLRRLTVWYKLRLRKRDAAEGELLSSDANLAVMR